MLPYDPVALDRRPAKEPEEPEPQKEDPNEVDPDWDSVAHYLNHIAPEEADAIELSLKGCKQDDIERSRASRKPQ